MGTRRKRERQQDLWIAISDVVETPGNAFYDRLNGILNDHKFDAKVEQLCRKYYKKVSMADRAYHSGAVLTELHEREVRSYIPEPERGRRKWDGEGKAEEQKRTYENRRRVRGERKKPLQKLRSELTEGSFAHLYETGGMRRVHLRGRNNILKRLVVHGAAFNLSLILRKTLGVGKPRWLQGLCLGIFEQFACLLLWIWMEPSTKERQLEHFAPQSILSKVDALLSSCAIQVTRHYLAVRRN